MRRFVRFIFTVVMLFLFCEQGAGQSTAPRFRALVVYENGGHHIAYSKAARPWLDKLAADSNFVIDYINNMDGVDSAYLARYGLFIQLDYPPYGWPAKAAKAFQDYIEQGKGGWIGFHHATLLGEFDGYSMWPWFSRLMGDIRFTNYIAGFASGKVTVEDSTHAVMKGVQASFVIAKEEWYTWNKSPRLNVQVLAHVEEDSYAPASTIKMGDHPVIWTNPHVRARNVYIFMGHGPDLFDNVAYTTLFRNAIFWASSR